MFLEQETCLHKNTFHNGCEDKFQVLSVEKDGNAQREEINLQFVSTNHLNA